MDKITAKRNEVVLEEPQSIIPIEEDLGLLTLEEMKQLRQIGGVKSEESFLSVFNKIENAKIIADTLFLTKEDIEKAVFSVLKGRDTKKETNTYVVFNMLFKRLPIERKFIEEQVYKHYGMKMRIKVFRQYYEWYKPEFFPNLVLIKEKPLEALLLSLVILYSPSQLNDDIIVNELIYHFKEKSIYAEVAIKAAVREFLTKVAPTLIEEKILQERFNLFDFLYKKVLGKVSLNEEQRLMKTLDEKMGKYKNTGFYQTLELFLEDRISKNIVDMRSLHASIIAWSLLTEIALKEGCLTISGINLGIRDTFVIDYIDHRCVKTDFKLIRQVLKFYNSRIIKGNKPDYFNVSMFSGKETPRKSSDIKHVSYMELAYDVLVSAIASEIYRTKERTINIKNPSDLYSFFAPRVIWLTFLTGCRISEIRDLRLEEVKLSLLAKVPYIHIRTSKDNDDRVFKLYRGNASADGTYQYDTIHLNILQDTIRVAEKVYKDIPIGRNSAKFLFPNSLLNKINRKVIANRFGKIQKENGLVCGSQYDIKSRDVYESYPDMRSKLENQSPLFGFHDLRHIKIEKLVTHGMTNIYEIRHAIGHKSIKSQESYKKAVKGVMEVARLMEERGHYGATNELVSPYMPKVPTNPNKKEFLLIKDVTTYLENEEFLQEAANNNYESAYDYIDTNTNCETKISCGETGFGCLGCNDFVSGKITDEAILNVSSILIHQNKVIDYEIARLNDRGLQKKRETNNFQRLLNSLLDRFEGIQKTKEHTLMSPKNFNLSEQEADKFLLRIFKASRKNDINKDVIKYIKKERGTLHSDIESRLSLLTNKLNKVIFK